MLLYENIIYCWPYTQLSAASEQHYNIFVIRYNLCKIENVLASSVPISCRLGWALTKLKFK